MSIAHLRLALLALSFACLPVATSFAANDDDLPTPDAKAASEIVALIKQLGDESYSGRETATEKLLSYGLPALKLWRKAQRIPTARFATVANACGSCFATSTCSGGWKRSRPT